MSFCKVEIRLGKIKDLKDYLRILLETYPNESREAQKYYFIKHVKDKEAFIAVVDNKVIGYITFSKKFWSSDTLFLHEFAVDRKYRSRGIGKHLLDKVKDVAKKNRIRRIFLDTAKINRRGIKFYLRNGFKKAGYVNNMYKEKIKCVLLSYRVG